jgi:hypothetical protein
MMITSDFASGKGFSRSVGGRWKAPAPAPVGRSLVQMEKSPVPITHPIAEVIYRHVAIAALVDLEDNCHIGSVSFVVDTARGFLLRYRLFMERIVSISQSAKRCSNRTERQ